MARTRRKYNHIPTLKYYHPFYQICCGNCHNCKDKKKDKKRKTEKKKYFKFDILASVYDDVI